MKLYNSYGVTRISIKDDKMTSAYMTEFVSYNVFDKDYIRKHNLDEDEINNTSTSDEETNNKGTNTENINPEDIKNINSEDIIKPEGIKINTEEIMP